MNPFRSVRTSALLACIVLCAAQARAAEDEPKAVAVAFAKALQAGDTIGVHERCVGAPEKVKIVDFMIEFMGTISKFSDACSKKFGPDNALSKSLAEGMPNFAAEAAKDDYKIDGDVATAFDKAAPDKKNPMKLKKVDGKWKVDLDARGDAPQIESMKPIMKIYRAATDDINADKYQTLDEAAVAIAEKIKALQK